MPERPPSLGDEAEIKYRVIREEAPLPGTRKGIVTALSTAIERGGIKRIVVEIGKPILIDRYVKEGELPSIPDAVDTEDSFSLIRNSKIYPFEPAAGISALHYLFQAFQGLSSRGGLPEFLLVSSGDPFDEGLFHRAAKAVPLQSFFGWPVRRSPEVPSGVALLCGRDEKGDYVSLRLSLDDYIGAGHEGTDANHQENAGKRSH